MMLARSEAKILHEKVSEKAYSDDDFIRILTTRSKAQLGATLNHYNNEYGNAINKVNIFFYKLLLKFSVIMSLFSQLIMKRDFAELERRVGQRIPETAKSCNHMFDIP